MIRASQIVLPVVSNEGYLDDLRRVTEGQTDDTLSELLVGRSRETMSWMRRNRVRFIPMFGRQSFKVEGKHDFYGGVNIEAVGGGWGLVDQLVKQAERLGVEIRYGTGLRKLLQDRSGAVTGLHVMGPDGYADIRGRNVVLACGGFEANPEMRVRYYGPGWESCRVRGTRYNTGDGLRAALEIDAQAFGGWSTCHAVQWDNQRAALRRPRGARQLPEALVPGRHHRQPERRALRRRGRRLPQPHLRQVRARGDEAAQAHRGADLRRQDHRHGAR